MDKNISYIKKNLMEIQDEKKDNLLIWYRKTGHFGPETLKTLVQRIKNIKIKGLIFLKYNIYAQTHGKIMVLKRLKKPYQPYYIIYFNFFYFEKLGTGYKYLLFLKNKYIGRLTTVPFTGKTSKKFVTTIFGFEQQLIK